MWGSLFKELLMQAPRVIGWVFVIPIVLEKKSESPEKKDKEEKDAE